MEDWNRWKEDNEAKTDQPQDPERQLLAWMLIEAMRDYVGKMQTEERTAAMKMQKKVAKLEAEAAKLRAALERVGDPSR